MPVENRQSGDMVSEAAMNDIGVQRADATSRASVLRRLRTSDLVFHMLTRGAAMAVLLLLGGVIAALVIGATPAFSHHMLTGAIAPAFTRAGYSSRRTINR